jgi:hypothetical protein
MLLPIRLTLGIVAARWRWFSPSAPWRARLIPIWRKFHGIAIGHDPEDFIFPEDFMHSWDTKLT